MNTKQIEAVLEVSRTLNFTKAAENLYITQPALTYSIKTFEEEVGFKIFERSGKGAILTVAGQYFVKQLREIEITMNNAIEYSLNLNHTYKDCLTLCLPTRKAIHFLPEIIDLFHQQYPDIQVNIKYIYGPKRIDSLLNGGSDLLFGIEDPTRKIPNTKSFHIFDSRIYLVCTQDDALAKKEIIHVEDLDDRTILIGGGSPHALQIVQKEAISRNKVSVLNSPDHQSSLTFIELKQAVNLIPGFLNDHTHEFAWVPYDTNEVIPCHLIKRNDDPRGFIDDFVKITQYVYVKYAHRYL